MRLQREFGVRREIQRSISKIIFLVYEGQKTEFIYFNGINDFKDDLNIDENIKLIPIFRSYVEKRWSNPKRILDQLLIDLKSETEAGMTFKSFMKKLIDFLSYDLSTTSILNTSEISKRIKNSLIHEFKLNESSILKNINSVIEKTEDILAEEFSINVLPQRIQEYIQDSAITYDPENDRLCLIVDRDFNSFTDEQYIYVAETCNDKNIELYVTNPCFEFWLFLHYDIKEEIDTEAIKKNLKNDEETFILQELKKLYPEYKKEEYDFRIFMPNIVTALNQIKNFEQDLMKLQNNIGSNLAILINSFFRKKEL